MITPERESSICKSVFINSNLWHAVFAFINTCSNLPHAMFAFINCNLRHAVFEWTSTRYLITVYTFLLKDNTSGVAEQVDQRDFFSLSMLLT